jgi:hypothetical protein
LSNNFGRFLLGLRLRTTLGQEQITYAPGVITVDGQAPMATWLFPTSEALVNPSEWEIKLQTTDNSNHSVRVVLDTNTNPNDGYAGILIGDTDFTPGTHTLDESPLLSIAPGTYYYYVMVSDGIDPPTTMYAKAANGQYLKLMVTNRLIHTFDLNRLAAFSSGPSEGAILQGFNFNDLAGSSMAGIPDLTADGKSELLIASRFGKPQNIATEGIGWGEAYMIYGGSSRLRGVSQLNSVGRGASPTIPGLAFPGIRAPVDTTWTEGLSDVTVIPDMDGDGLPELVFSFPRVESVSLADISPAQHPDLFPDYPGLGDLEYDAYDYLFGQWAMNTAQFTRGGIVIISSHSPMLQQPARLNRKGNRVVDLAEVGQVFDDTREPRFRQFIWLHGSDTGTITGCDPNDPSKESDYDINWIETDICFEDQGPGGFDNYFSAPQFFGIPQQVEYPPGSGLVWWDWQPDPYQPPLANVRALPYFHVEDANDPFYPPAFLGNPCGDPPCVWYETWPEFAPFPTEHFIPSGLGDPDPLMYNAKSWNASFLPGPASGWSVWTGFCGRDSARVVPGGGGNECGARILGQQREDRFGTSVGADGDFLYISAPQRSALKAGNNNLALGDNVPELEATTRAGSGVVYQLRTNAHPYGEPYTVTQLWIEPNMRYPIDPNDPNYPDDPNDPNTPPFYVFRFPHIDYENPERVDTAMPTPHQYIIETIGFTRGGDDYWPELQRYAPDPPPPTFDQAPAADASGPLTDRQWLVDYTGSWGLCGDTVTIEDYWGVPSITISDSPLWPHYSAAAAEYYIDRTSQIVGPHVDAHLRSTRGLGDVNDDGNPDFAVGSAEVRASFTDPQNPTGDIVGAVFIVFGRPLGLEGDVLLDRMALPVADTHRVHGVLLRGTTANDKLGRVFSDAGDFDGNGVSDVVVGAEGYDSDRGEAVVILGSKTLESPQGGWQVDDILAAGRGIRFIGEAQGDLAGANVAGAGDVDGDGLGDLLIAAPGADGSRGAVYLIYGSPALAGQDVNLSQVGTLALPGAKFLGRALGDQLGGGFIQYPVEKLYPEQNDSSTPVRPTTDVYSQGVIGLGDIDGDGFADFAISAMLANPNAREHSGEVYILYGRGDK